MSLSAFPRTSVRKAALGDKGVLSSGVEVALFWGGSLVGVERTASSANLSLYDDDKNAIASLLSPCLRHFPSLTFELFSEKDGRFYLHSPQGAKTSRQEEVIENEFIHLDTDAPVSVALGPFTIHARRVANSPPLEKTPIDFRFAKIFFCILTLHFALVTALAITPSPQLSEPELISSDIVLNCFAGKARKKPLMYHDCRRHEEKRAVSLRWHLEKNNEKQEGKPIEDEPLQIQKWGLFEGQKHTEVTMLNVKKRLDREKGVPSPLTNSAMVGTASTNVGTHDVILRNPLSRGEILQSIRQALPKMRRCFEDRLKHNSHIDGKIVFSWTIAPSGDVVHVKAKSNSLHDEKITQCLFQRVSEFRFPKPRGGGSVKVTHPFAFKLERDQK